jgi:hypothetical protein
VIDSMGTYYVPLCNPVARSGGLPPIPSPDSLVKIPGWLPPPVSTGFDSNAQPCWRDCRLAGENTRGRLHRSAAQLPVPMAELVVEKETVFLVVPSIAAAVDQPVRLVSEEKAMCSCCRLGRSGRKGCVAKCWRRPDR